VRGMHVGVDCLGGSTGDSRKRSVERRQEHLVPDSPPTDSKSVGVEKQATTEEDPSVINEEQDSVGHLGVPPLAPTDPLVMYARRSGLGPSRQNSTFSSPMVPSQHLPSYIDGPIHAEPGPVVSGSVAFPSHGRTESYVLPARSRTSSTPGGEVSRKLLRTLSTVSIHESIEGLPDGVSGVAEFRKYIVGKLTTEADAPPSEIPREFGFDEGDRDGKDDRKEGSGKFQIEC